jgi:hypothetical protein
MGFTLDTFASECRQILKADPGPVGRGKVRDLVQEVLKDDKFLATHLNENTPDRHVIYEDPELGFCICAHMSHGAREANPHDHGSSWAIYGQAFGETEMSDWDVIEPASEGNPGKVRRAKVYALKPGMAHIYKRAMCITEARIHYRALIEGKNTQKMKRLAYGRCDENLPAHGRRRSPEKNSSNTSACEPGSLPACCALVFRGCCPSSDRLCE